MMDAFPVDSIALDGAKVTFVLWEMKL